MKVGDKYYSSLWFDKKNPGEVVIIDQSRLPFSFETMTLSSVEEVFNAIKNMNLRGAPLIGVAASFGMYFATLERSTYTEPYDFLKNAARYLKSARPTAVNLAWAVDSQIESLIKIKNTRKLADIAFENAVTLRSNEVENCRLIGEHGLGLIEEISGKKRGEPVNILTHCNAGWLACIEWGTATAPIYKAHDKGIKVHVWVDETRPRNQGARLTAWELGEYGVPYTLITDNAGGNLMRKGDVDLVLVGSDRTDRKGNVVNKTGTYLKALAAKDNNIPFYVALPLSSIDTSMKSAFEEVVIEERPGDEVTMAEGLYNGEPVQVRLVPDGTPVANSGFDITPARMITGLITEKGIIAANEKEIVNLFSQ